MRQCAWRKHEMMEASLGLEPGSPVLAKPFTPDGSASRPRPVPRSHEEDRHKRGHGESLAALKSDA